MYHFPLCGGASQSALRRSIHSGVALRQTVGIPASATLSGKPINRTRGGIDAAHHGKLADVNSASAHTPPQKFEDVARSTAFTVGTRGSGNRRIRDRPRGESAEGQVAPVHTDATDRGGAAVASSAEEAAAATVLREMYRAGETHAPHTLSGLHGDNPTWAGANAAGGGRVPSTRGGGGARRAANSKGSARSSIGGSGTVHSSAVPGSRYPPADDDFDAPPDRIPGQGPRLFAGEMHGDFGLRGAGEFEEDYSGAGAADLGTPGSSGLSEGAGGSTARSRRGDASTTGSGGGIGSEADELASAAADEFGFHAPSQRWQAEAARRKEEAKAQLLRSGENRRWAPHSKC